MNKEFEQNVVLEQIKEDLQQFKNENLMRCPNCEHIFEWNDADYNPAESEYTCPQCRATSCEEDYEIVNMLDYIEDMYLNYAIIKNQNNKGENNEQI